MVLAQSLGGDVRGDGGVGGEGLNLDVGIGDTCGSGGGPGAVVGRIGESVIVRLLGTVIGRRGVAVCPGMDGVGGTRGGRVVEVGRGVCGGGRVVVTRVDGAISGWMRAVEEGGFRHPAMVDGRVRGGVEGRGGGVPLV